MKTDRVTNRAKKRVMVRYGVTGLDRTGFTRNVSETGMAIQTNQVFAPGTMLQIEMKFPDRTVTLWARVVWAQRVPAALAHRLPCGMGVQFVDPGSEWPAYFKTWARIE